VVRRYGQSIGRATVDIAAGAHVHTHNLDMDHTDRAYEFGTARTVLPVKLVVDPERRCHGQPPPDPQQY